jgi:hypothetical protein
VDSQEDFPVLVRSAPARTPLAVPAVLVEPLPAHPAPQSTSTTASLLPAVPRESSSPSAFEVLRVEHPPSPETVQAAFPFVADLGADWDVFAAAAETVPFSVAAFSAPVSWPASVLLLADPVQPAAQSTSASATTSSVEDSSPRSTELEEPQPVADSQCDVLAPCRRALSVAAASSPSSVTRVLARRVSGRSLPDPVLLLSHEPPAVSQSDLARDRSATVSTAQSPVHAADAAVLRSVLRSLESPGSGGVAASRSGPVLSLRQDPPPLSQYAAAPSGVARLC